MKKKEKRNDFFNSLVTPALIMDHFFLCASFIRKHPEESECSGKRHGADQERVLSRGGKSCSEYISEQKHSAAWVFDDWRKDGTGQSILMKQYSSSFNFCSLLFVLPSGCIWISGEVLWWRSKRDSTLRVLYSFSPLHQSLQGQRFHSLQILNKQVIISILWCNITFWSDH